MSRRHRAERREIIPDAKFGDLVLAKFMNSLMYDGKKSAAEGIIYGAFDTIQTKTKQDPLGGRGLAGVDVRHDPEVAVVFDGVLAGHWKSLCGRSRANGRRAGVCRIRRRGRFNSNRPRLEARYMGAYQR